MTLQVAANTHTTTINGLEEGTSYYFRIRALRTAGNTQYSNEVNLKTNQKPTLNNDIELDVSGSNTVYLPRNLFRDRFNDADGELLSNITITSIPNGINQFRVQGTFGNNNITTAPQEVTDFQLRDDGGGNGRLRYRASDEFTGQAVFTFTASDGFDDSDQRTERYELMC